MENPTKPCTNNMMSENDRSDVAVLENVEEKNCGDETNVKIETSNNEAEQGHIRKLDEFDPPLDIPIALKKVAKSKEGISVSQKKYTLDLLTETGMLGCLPDTLIEFNCKLGNSYDQVLVDKEQYQQLAPYEKHMKAVNRILRYLKNTPKSLPLVIVPLFGAIWRSKKQSVVARNNAEAEYRVMSLEICEEIWLQKVLLNLHQECETPLKLFYDNKAAISIANY
ncbi:putative mitochondrial protein [Cucumis melo var. makuwa]|uniref:Mitochondrial protein n=1 Tax=Cucumis melo var. makuwa TaxID=1194695 RepID=A0A5A7USJ5_CUCMM|nr:putative mitochondrial protein [Cucumis melo var. makuwa]TYK23731.1 putative mitochondrial protein [Cucumis melo var. makuwa]